MSNKVAQDERSAALRRQFEHFNLRSGTADAAEFPEGMRPRLVSVASSRANFNKPFNLANHFSVIFAEGNLIQPTSVQPRSSVSELNGVQCDHATRRSYDSASNYVLQLSDVTGPTLGQNPIQGVLAELL